MPEWLILCQLLVCIMISRFLNWIIFTKTIAIPMTTRKTPPGSWSDPHLICICIFIFICIRIYICICICICIGARKTPSGSWSYPHLTPKRICCPGTSRTCICIHILISICISILISICICVCICIYICIRIWVGLTPFFACKEWDVASPTLLGTLELKQQRNEVIAKRSHHQILFCSLGNNSGGEMELITWPTSSLTSSARVVSCWTIKTLAAIYHLL